MSLRHKKIITGSTNSRADMVSLIFVVMFFLFLLLASVIAFWVVDNDSSPISRLLSSSNLRVGVLGSVQQEEDIKKKYSLIIIENLVKQYDWTMSVTSFSSHGEMYRALDEGRIDIVADAVIDHRTTYDVRYSISYGKTSPSLVYFPDVNADITSKENFSDNQLLLIKNSWQSHFARNLSYLYKDLVWQEFPDFWMLEDMIYAIQRPPGGYLLVTDEELDFYHQIYPDLKIALGFDSVYLAFALARDNVVLEAFVSSFIQTYSTNKESEESNKSFLSSILRPAQLETFLINVKQRFHKYADLFFLAANEYGLDWRLIAAVAYQESLWNEKAVSPTGVRGLMMLTRTTAKFLNVADRTDPAQSVDGGTRYIIYLKNLLPKRIQEPDKTWLALAAYNFGLAHLKDVRIITQMHGKDPDKWTDVREYLPYIEKPEWYRKSKNGYARGREARKYVDNIRNYYQVLIGLRTELVHSDDNEESAIQVHHQVQKARITLPKLISLRY